MPSGDRQDCGADKPDAGRPAAYSPELNAIEQVWQYLRDRYLSGCLFADEATIVEACCNAWHRLLEETGRIRSLAGRPWTYAISP